MTRNAGGESPTGGLDTHGPEAQSLTFGQTVRPILLAPLGALVVTWLFDPPNGGPVSSGFWLLSAVVYLVALGGVLCFVLPAFLLVPSSRQPPLWIAVPWGVLVAWIVAFATGPINSGLRDLFRWEVSIGFGAAGAAAALVYVIAARRAGSSATWISRT